MRWRNGYPWEKDGLGAFIAWPVAYEMNDLAEAEVQYMLPAYA